MRLLISTIIFFITLRTAFLNVELNKSDNKENTELVTESDDRPLIFATLGGGMVALEQLSGKVIWTLKDEPAVKVPIQDDSFTPRFLPDPRHGSLYMFGPQGGERHFLKKLPFTIPQLVANAPCRSSDGIMYTGKKSDTWFMIDPKTGFRQPISGFEKSNLFDNKGKENVCPIDKDRAIYVARTEYNILMMDANNKNQKWNVTFFDYTSNRMGQEMTNNYGTIHFASTSNGRVTSFDRKTGELVWSHDLESPVIAAYLLDRDGLLAVPFNSIGDNTMDHIIEDAANMRKGFRNSNMQLFPTLYVGEHNYGLYALSSLVDKHTITISTEAHPLLLEGPLAENQGSGSYSDSVNIHYKTDDFNYDTTSKGYLLLGHYKVPEYVYNWIQVFPSPSLLPIANIAEGTIKLIEGSSDAKMTEISWNQDETPTIKSIQAESENIVNPLNIDIKNSNSIAVQTEELDEDNEKLPFRWDLLYKHAYLWINQQENKGLKFALIILVGLVITMFWYLQSQAREFQHLSQNGSKSQHSNSSSSSRKGMITAMAEDLGDGFVRVGKIAFHSDQVLGKGCEGTFVFRGSFDKRNVAVKRLLPECFTFADREVALLRESDAHPNVVRYYCMEQDKQFRYIALELCSATLQDYIERKLDFECTISPIEILFQAATGLTHLHSLDIVHRDIKPHNVLLSLPNTKSEVRAMISDFGLCKKLNLGRNSFSRRSGVTGTEGWIAPEILNGERTTTSVDVFSLGCVFYYVLSKGKHPFGDVLRRQANILSDEFNLDHLNSTLPESDVALTKTLIRMMISAEACKRPPSSAVIKHPIFWSKQTALTFLQDVSDRVELVGTDTSLPASALLDLPNTGGTCGVLPVVRGDWRLRIDPAVAADLRRRRTYVGHSICDLLRAIRNKKHHYRELSPEAQKNLGPLPEGFVKYWLDKFPLLLVHSWVQMQAFRDETTFRDYYHAEYQFLREDIPELHSTDYDDDYDPDMDNPEKNRLFLKSKIYYEAPDQKFYNKPKNLLAVNTNWRNHSDIPSDGQFKPHDKEARFSPKKARPHFMKHDQYRQNNEEDKRHVRDATNTTGDNAFNSNKGFKNRLLSPNKKKYLRHKNEEQENVVWSLPPK